MNELALLNQNQIELASIEELKAELSRTLKISSDYLVYMSLIWSELNNRGVDLSGLKSGLFEYVPLIATNQLDASLVIEFAGNKTLLSALSRLPIFEQEKIAKTKTVEFVELDESGNKKVYELDLTKAKSQQLYQVFGGEYGLRNIDQQFLLISNKKQARDKSKTPTKTSKRKIDIDENKEYMIIGDNKVRISLVLESLSEIYGINFSEIIKKS